MIGCTLTESELATRLFAVSSRSTGVDAAIAGCVCKQADGGLVVAVLGDDIAIECSQRLGALVNGVGKNHLRTGISGHLKELVSD